jgi:hypothetical protein
MTTSIQESICPGCGLKMPASSRPIKQGYYNTSMECWGLYTEVLCAEYSNAFLFGQVHQLTVDTYSSQHAGGPHPDKSVVVHLAGLFLMLERGIRPPNVPPFLQRLGAGVETWPHFTPPADVGPMTVFDIALCESPEEHMKAVREWARIVWDCWSEHHAELSSFISRHLDTN